MKKERKYSQDSPEVFLSVTILLFPYYLALELPEGYL